MIQFRSVEPDDLGEIRAFLAENGWEKRVAEIDRFRKMIENASRTVVAIEDERIVGFARALCDDASNGYIGTVAVAEDERGQGIGREMVGHLMGDDPNITWVLRAGRGSEEFWKKMGFEPSAIAMERTRKES
jgi:N-acetylglutamate synthase-like GNAT family acetyltransferase